MKKMSLVLVILVAASCRAQQACETEEGAYPVVGAAITSASEVQQTAGLPESKLELASSDTPLVEAFNRAKRQAMGFVFYARLNKNYELEGHGPSSLLGDDGDDGGDPNVLYARMLDGARPGRSRWDYPEVPYAWIGDFVTGMMGIGLEAAPAGLSAQQGFWVSAVVKTQPRLGSQNAWTELRNLPIRANEVTVRHERRRKTVLTNQHGPALIWQATFEGAYETLLLNGRPMRAHTEEGSSGRVTSSLRVTVSGGGTATVETPNQ